MKDLAAPLGGAAPPSGSLDAGTPTLRTAQAAAPATHLFPDAHLQVNRVRGMDADVRFTARSIEAGSVPFKEVSLRVRLDHGLLSLDPFSFEMPQGQLSGEATIDARSATPVVHIDVRVKDIELNQLKGRAPDAEAPLGGVMQARLVVDGTGDSMHRVMANANGAFTLVLPDGEIRSAFAELTGINVARGIGLLITRTHEKATIRCGVAQFAIQAGVMNSQTVLFDTENVVITGKGEIILGPEELNLEITGKPKKFRFTRLRAPIEIRGHLSKPAVGIDVPSVIKQGAVAAALGTLLTPLAAAIAFVDPGLAKDQNCARLIAEVESSGPKVPRSGPMVGSTLRPADLATRTH